MPHYYDREPVSPSKRNKIFCEFEKVRFTFFSDASVFSKKQIDFGSRLLITTAINDISQNDLTGRLLDLGCGYGVIGIVMKKVFPWLSVVMADINQRAIELCTENAKLNQIENIDIQSSDGWTDISGSFSLILMNPPVRAGKNIVFDFYDGAFEHMTPGGRLYVVLQKKQGAPSSIEHLKDLFGNCRVLDKKSGYHILMAEKI